MLDSMKPALIKTIIISIVWLILLFILYPFVTIGAWERGIVFSKFTWVKDTVLGEGLHFKLPIFEDITVVDVKTHKVVFSWDEGSRAILGAASSDLQDVFVSATVTYRPEESKIGQIYQQVGLDYENKKVVPLIIDLIKTHTAKFQVKDILTNRDKIRTAVQEDLSKQLAVENFILENVSLTNFDFNADFKKSIETKQVETQEKEKAQVILERKTIEAQQKVAEAKANAEAEIAAAEWQKKSKILEWEGIQEYNKLIQQQVTPQVLEYKRLENQRAAIEQWKWEYPNTYMGNGSAVPLVNIGGTN